MAKILVTDDTSEYRRAVIDLLTLEGFDVIDAENGVQALEAARQELPQLILCDVDMPVVNGFMVLQAVRADPLLVHIPFVLVTGHEDAESIQRGKQLGADGYLVKPMNVEELLLTIRDLLHSRKLSR